MARTPVRGKKSAAEVTSTDEARELDDVVNAIRKRFGDASLFNAVDKRQPERIPTGAFTLDYALLGGLARGKMHMLHGKRSGGKTTLLLKTIANAQRIYPDERCVLIDVEHTYDPVWGGKLGVDNDRLLVHQPSSGEEAVDSVDAFMHAKEVSLVGMDSIAALTPLKEIGQSVEDDATPGLQAKLCTRMVRKLNAAFVTEYNRQHYPTFVCLNQHRAKIGGWSPAGDPLSLPGGQALEFFMGTMLRIYNKETMGKNQYGIDVTDFNEHSFKVEKNKFNAGMRAGDYQLLRRPNDELGLNEGDIDDAGTMLAFAKKMGVYTGGGRAWVLSLPDSGEIKIDGGAAAAIQLLYDDRDKLWELRNHLIALAASDLRMPQYFINSIYDTPRCG